MPEVTLVAEPSRATGSRPSGRLRTEGKVPAVVYGHGIKPLSVAVDRRALRAALHTEAGHNALINLHVGGDSHLTIVKDLQRHPVRNEVVHVDFIVVSRDEVVTVDVQVVLHGEARAVLSEGGTVDQHLHTITVRAKPADIPTEVPVDIAGLTIGDQVRVADLQLPAGVTADVDPDQTVVVAQVSRAAAAAEGGAPAAPAGEPGAGAASAEGAEGD